MIFLSQFRDEIRQFIIKKRTGGIGLADALGKIM